MKKNNTSNKNKEPIDVSKFTTLEDLIHAAMGPPDKNIVNFKMVQAILMILAQQLRMLERPVDYRSLEEETPARKETEKAEKESEKPERDSDKMETKSKKSKKKSDTSEKDKRESERSDREDEKAKSDSEKPESESEQSESESEKAEKESQKTGRERKKAGRDKKKTGQERIKADQESEKTGGERDKTHHESEKTEGEKEKTQGKKKKKEPERVKTEGEKENEGPKIEKTEGKKEKKERDREKTEGGRDKTDQESEKTESEKEKTQAKKKKIEREREKTEGAKENDGPEIEKAEGKKEKKERDREKTEGGRDKTDQESEKTEGEKEKTQGKKKKKEQETEKTGKEKEGTEIEKTEGKKEKKERERERAEGEKEKKGQETEKTEGKKDKKDREVEKTEKEREKTEGKIEKKERERETAEGEKEKKGQETEKTEGKKEKKDREGEKTESEREKTDVEKEKKGPEGEKTEGKKEKKEREKIDVEKEKKGSEGEKTEAKKEKKERERDELDQEREKKARGREKTEREREKTEQEKEKAGRDREKTGQERQQTGREREEKERNIPSVMEKPDREKEQKQKPTIEESYISVTDKDRVLLVEKIPSARRGGSQSSMGSIPVVTLSQFRILEAAVRALEEKVAPIPLPSMPDNQTLREDLAKGSASLTGTMEAMQVSARVQAAEEAISRMAEMLSNMAAEDTQGERKAPKKRSVKLQSSSESETSTSSDMHTSSSGLTQRTESMISRFSQRNKMAQKSSIFGVKMRRSMDVEAEPKVEPQREPQPTDFVSHPEMTQALGVLQANLVRSLFARSALVQKIAEQTANTVQMAADRAALVTEVDDRIKSLTSLLNKRAKQHENIDTEMTTQLDNFNVHLVQVRVDLRDGIILFESTGSEMQALKELGSKYDELVEMLDMTSHSHNELASGQNLLNDDVQGILTCIEMLQEEKSDRDEMLDRLRDKADFSAVSGLLPANDFKEVQADLEKKLEQCHGKFLTQETVWQSAIEDLTAIADEKSDLYHLLKLKEDTEHHLSEINKKIRCLAYALGEPKAALLARQLSQGARCGACSKPAIQHAVDKSYMKDEKDKPVPKPPRLPPAYYSYIGAGDPCEVETNPPTMDEAKQHVCHRWVGGSHTLLTDSVKRAKAAPLPAIGPPTKKYTQAGEDGKLYNMEETLDPCQQCNPKVGDEVRVDGAGDTDHTTHNVHIIGGPQTANK